MAGVRNRLTACPMHRVVQLGTWITELDYIFIEISTSLILNNTYYTNGVSPIVVLLSAMRRRANYEI